MLLSPRWHSHPLPFLPLWKGWYVYLECHLPVILPTLYQSPHGRQGQSKYPPLPLLWLLQPYSPRGVTERVGKPGKEGEGVWGENTQGPGGFSTPPEGECGTQTPAYPPFLPLQKQLLLWGTPEGEADLGQDRIWGSWIPVPNDQINVALIAVYSDSQNLSSNTSYLMKPFPLVPLKDMPFLPCTLSPFQLICSTPSPCWLHTKSTH